MFHCHRTRININLPNTICWLLCKHHCVHQEILTEIFESNICKCFWFGCLSVCALLRLCVLSSSLLQQVFIQLSQLLQETPVWDDASPPFDVIDGVYNRHVLVDHQVSQEECGRATAAHHTVNKKLIWRNKQYGNLTQRCVWWGGH